LFYSFFKTSNFTSIAFGNGKPRSSELASLDFPRKKVTSLAHSSPYPHELSERKQGLRKHLSLRKVSHLELGRGLLLENTDENLEVTVSIWTTKHVWNSAEARNELRDRAKKFDFTSEGRRGHSTFEWENAVFSFSQHLEGAGCDENVGRVGIITDLLPQTV
jgi:hypothetical protein